jgi:CubicO group peptidase (beta-lactamase class C family)
MTTAINGKCAEQFAPVHEAFSANFESGVDLGASVAVTIDGEMVVDLWGGHLDEEKTQPWQEDTIVNVYSTTKTMSFLCALVLADRGQLDFDAPVKNYWPEFAQNGKDNVLVWHLMNHAAGLSGMDVPVTEQELFDWEKMTGLLAAQKPWWEPGSATAYHALTQGYLIGEVVRRITGHSIGKFFQEEIASRLNADFHIGVPESEFSRIGKLIPSSEGTAIASPEDPESIAFRTFNNPTARALASRTPEWRKAEIPAANGHGNARSVAKIHANLACKGTANNVALFSEKTAESVMQERISGVDMALQAPLRFGLGFGINSSELPLSPNQNVCFWGGWGGSVVIIDQDARMSVAFMMNKMHEGLLGDTRSASLIQAAYTSLA